MNPLGRRMLGCVLICAICTIVFGLVPRGTAAAAEIVLKDGRVLSGKLGMTAGLAEIPQGFQTDGSGALRLILFLDDDLRRIFVSKRQVQEVREEVASQVVEKFRIRQRALRRGRTVKSVGTIARIQPFDEFGRRIFTMNTRRGEVDIIQGMTEITPSWTKVEGISHLWDMRIATSSIPNDVLAKILAKQIDPTNVEDRKKIARFYLQSQRYKEAYKVLEQILADSPDDTKLREQLEPSIRSLRQLRAQRLLKELESRREAGQHRLVLALLKTFPSDGVAGEILQAVREMVEEYAALQKQRDTVIVQFDALLAKIGSPGVQKRIEPIREELAAELNIDNLDRMAAFSQMVDDPDMLPEEKLALAISGWLLGSDSAAVNLPVALSALDVRNIVRRYLNEPVKLNRANIYKELHSQEARSPVTVAKLIAHMKPPTETPPPPAETPGYYELEVPGLSKEPPVPYLVQLPPEYDPHRRYPTVITLHGSGTTAALQVDWWAGGRDPKGMRQGQATRQGYIVIAPNWTTEHQKKYQYSAREHAAVLNTLRDASRRFSIDTDRVFLSGHSIGGDAAWDIGLAHPDLWAGVIPIVAKSDRYCALYWENAARVPYYFIAGELDGGKMSLNARDLDRYLKRGYNATVVEFLGRGHENFHDEILRLFDWMRRFKRDFFPREFTCTTMRHWDSFFWWIELDRLPDKAMVDPLDWPPPRGTQAVRTKASLTVTNGVNIRTGAGRATVWLSPEMIDFERPVNIVVNGQRIYNRLPPEDTQPDAARPKGAGRDAFVEPNLPILLEDVRTRADRQHPFWTKVEMRTGRGG